MDELNQIAKELKRIADALERAYPPEVKKVPNMNSSLSNIDIVNNSKIRKELEDMLKEINAAAKYSEDK